MKTILIVDDEKNFRSMLAEGLEEYSEHFKTLLAADGQEAIEMLQANRVDVVVTDLKMPRTDGFVLLAFLSKNRPETPVIVMTAYGTQEVRHKLNAYEVFSCLEKPIDFNEFVQTLFRCLEASAEGRIRGIPLPAFLQLVEMERKTCTLHVRSSGREAVLYFRDGELLQADNGVVDGEPAVYDIVCWESPEIEIERTCKTTQKTIRNTLQAIMMDAFRIKDETNHKRTQLSHHQEKVAPGENMMDLGKANQDSLSTREALMASAKEILDVFIDLQGVTAACLVGRDGFLLESSARTRIDTEMIAAIAANGFGAAESMGHQLGKQGLSLSMIEYETGSILLSPVGTDGFVVIVTEQNANLGMIRLQLKRQVAQLATTTALV